MEGEEPYGPPELLQELNMRQELEDRRRLYEENGVMVAEYLGNTRPAQEWFQIRAPQRVTFFGAIMGLTLSIFLILLAVGLHALIISYIKPEEVHYTWWYYLFQAAKPFIFF